MQQWHHFVYLMCCIGTKIWIWIWWGFAARNGHLGAAAGRDAILFNVNSEFQPATPILSSSNSEFQLLQSIPAICPAQPGIISSAEQAAERPHPSSKPHEALVAHPIQTRVGGRDHEVAGLRSLEHNVRVWGCSIVISGFFSEIMTVLQNSLEKELNLQINERTTRQKWYFCVQLIS